MQPTSLAFKDRAHRDALHFFRRVLIDLAFALVKLAKVGLALRAFAKVRGLIIGCIITAFAVILAVAVDRALPIISVYSVNSPPRINLTMADKSLPSHMAYTVWP